MTSSYRIPDARPISPEESQLSYAQTQGLVMAEEQAQQEQVNNQKEAKATAPQTAKTQAENLQSLKEPTGLGGVAKEIGTAVVGAGIDAVEGIGSNLEQTFTGNLNNPKFVPTWLQVDDKVEPMNKTWWGQLTRSIGEYGLLSLATRGAAKGAAAGSPFASRHAALRDAAAVAGRFEPEPGRRRGGLAGGSGSGIPFCGPVLRGGDRHFGRKPHGPGGGLHHAEAPGVSLAGRPDRNR